jgi:adenylate cyclase
LDPNKAASIKNKKSSITGRPRPYSIAELAKHIDPTLLRDLAKIQIDNLTRKQLTIVFWDVSGFSDLCNDLDEYPEAISYFLSQYFSSAIKIIYEHDGILDKFIGDGILAYFGYDNSRGSGDPYNAIRAALEFRNTFHVLRQDFAKYCKEYNGIDKININLKCGMHKGPAFLHYFSTDMRNGIILMGRTVNLASRLEGIAENDEILVTKRLKTIVQDKFESNEIPIKDRVEKEKIKSFEEEDTVYGIIGEIGHTKDSTRM